MDGDDNKPFCCTSPGCGMRFTNEDHLTVHQKKHEMSLSLNCSEGANDQGACRTGGHNNTANINSMLFVDQTPTPTRFIRNCEEVGLFQDLQNVNPFEDHFRKAVEATKTGNSLPTNESLRVSADSDILHTPSVLTADLESVDSRLVENSEVNEIDLDTPVPHVGTDDTLILCDAENDEMMIISSSTSPPPPPPSPPIASPVPDSSIEADETVTTSYNVEDENLSILPTSESPEAAYAFASASTTTTTFTAAADVTNAIKQAPTATDVGNLVQFILRLPDGRAIPVTLPSMPMIASTATGSPNIDTHTKATRANATTLMTKQILKNTLTGGQMATTSGMARAHVGVSDFMTFDSTSNDSDSHDKQLSESKRSLGGREHTDEKRMKFLERNRAAATRCRQKRKQWVQSLEGKADELNSVNQQLQNEVTSLRNEVAQLKSMLLAHKDCPVTQQQQRGQFQQLNGLCTTTPTILIHSDNDYEVIRIGASEAIASSALTNRTQTVHLVAVSTNSATTTLTSTNATPVIVRTLKSSGGLMTQSRTVGLPVPEVCHEVSINADASTLEQQEHEVCAPATRTLLAKTLRAAPLSIDGQIVITIDDEHQDHAS